MNEMYIEMLLKVLREIAESLEKIAISIEYK